MLSETVFYLVSDLTFLQTRFRIPNFDAGPCARARAHKYFAFPKRDVIAGLLILKRLIYSPDRSDVVFARRAA